MPDEELMVISNTVQGVPALVHRAWLAATIKGYEGTLMQWNDLAPIEWAKWESAAGLAGDRT